MRKINKFKNIITRHLPKTGQTAMYSIGDDGQYEAGWWRGRLNSNNRTRFIAKTISGADIVFDRATGLMWAANGSAAGCNGGMADTFEHCILTANGLNFAGFTDWRLPNINELLSLVNYTLTSPSILQPPFSNTVSNFYWTSTTYVTLSTKAWVISFVNGRTYYVDKVDNLWMRSVRGGL